MLIWTGFVYGSPVSEDNFIGREEETRHLKLDLEYGVSSVIVSSRGMGKTSLVKRAISQLNGRDKEIAIVYRDNFDCRCEYDFYNRFATSLIEQTASSVEQSIENATHFLGGVAPTISIVSDPTGKVSLSLGITPKTHSSERILNLSERIAKELGKHIVVCIDEFHALRSFPEPCILQTQSLRSGLLKT